MTISNRIVIALSSFAVAYCSIALGEMMHFWATWNGLTMLATIAITVIAVVFVVSADLLDAFECSLDKHKDAPFLSVGLLCFASYLFGLVAAPIKTLGPLPTHWFSGWTIVLLVGAIPMIIVIKDIVLDAYHHVRTARDAKQKVIEFPRRDKK